MADKIKITHAGSLENVGYNLGEGEQRRHEALRKAVKKYGAGEVVKKLNALRTFMKPHPHYHKMVTEDMNYVQRME